MKNNKPKFKVRIKAINPEHTGLASLAEKIVNEDKDLIKLLEKKLAQAIENSILPNT